MGDRIKSIKGLFGQNIHYKDGIKVGESWLGLFEGTQNHYDATGKRVGHSVPSVFADLVHYDEHGSCVGLTHTGAFGQKNHYSAKYGYIGSTWDGLIGESTDISDESDFFGSHDPDDILSSEW